MIMLSPIWTISKTIKDLLENAGADVICIVAIVA